MPYLVLMAACKLEARSEEHTSELQSQSNLVCRLLLEKKKNMHRKISGQLYNNSHLAAEQRDHGVPLIGIKSPDATSLFSHGMLPETRMCFPVACPPPL